MNKIKFQNLNLFIKWTIFYQIQFNCTRIELIIKFSVNNERKLFNVISIYDFQIQYVCIYKQWSYIYIWICSQPFHIWWHEVTTISIGIGTKIENYVRLDTFLIGLDKKSLVLFYMSNYIITCYLINYLSGQNSYLIGLLVFSTKINEDKINDYNDSNN